MGRAEAWGDADLSRMDAGRWPCMGEMGLGMEGQEEHQDPALGTAISKAIIRPHPLSLLPTWAL